jgi:hypothetical protein
MVRVSLPNYLPVWIYRPLRRAKQALLATHHKGLDLSGDRDVECPFVAGQMPTGPGEALDFGCGGTYQRLIAVRRGVRVTGIALEPESLCWQHPACRFVQGDLAKADLPSGHFNLVINRSSVEHAGLAGRYGVTEERDDGDLEAMARLRDLMKPGALQLLTIPVGQDEVFPPYHRVYGEDRLPRLLDRYEVEYKEFWTKDQANRYIPRGVEAALRFNASYQRGKAYALGCFRLRRPPQSP